MVLGWLHITTPCVSVPVFINDTANPANRACLSPCVTGQISTNPDPIEFFVGHHQNRPRPLLFLARDWVQINVPNLPPAGDAHQGSSAPMAGVSSHSLSSSLIGCDRSHCAISSVRV
jgi:hypothetical protein